MKVAAREFGEHPAQQNELSGGIAVTTGKSIQWNGLRYLLSEVLYYLK